MASDAFVHRISGQADESSGRDTLSNYHAIASNVGIACLSVVVSFVVFWGGADHASRYLQIPHHLAQSFPGASRHGFWLRALLPDEKADGVAREAQGSCFRLGGSLALVAGYRALSESGYARAPEGLTVRSAGFLAHRSAGTALA